MRSRADEVRRRIEKRKRSKERMNKNLNNRLLWAEDEEKYGFDKVTTYVGGPDDQGHPLFRKELFVFKILLSAFLVLVVAILFRNESPKFDTTRTVVTKTMEKEFQFAYISNWYEKQFGKPLAFLPFKNSEKEDKTKEKLQYAMPASGKILEEFSDNGQRIAIETSKQASVDAMSEGIVSFVGNKDGFGKTVIIQHPDKSESWYGNLAKVDVSPYDFVEKGDIVGKASDSKDGAKGEFYFAIKKGDDFIDPIQVIPFE